MIVFHAVSVYQLLTLILYKNKIYSTQESCLIIRDILFEKILMPDTLYDYFDNIIIYKDYWNGRDIEEQEKIIVNYYDNLLENENGISLNNAEKIIIGCAHNTFGMYVSIKGIPFIFLEDAAGLASRSWLLDQINIKQLELKYQLIVKYGLITGKSNLIEKIICDFIAQEDDFDEKDDKYINFCTAKELGNCSEEERRNIMSIFTNLNKINVEEDCIIFLTQHFANLRTLSFEEQVIINQVVMDYYLKNEKVVIKPHPDDLMYYPLLFPDYQIIREKFPAEFLPYICSNKVKGIATISSTSIFSLRSCFDYRLELGTDFEKIFLDVHRYYTSIKILEWLKSRDAKLCGINYFAYTNLQEYNTWMNKKNENDYNICVLGEIDEEIKVDIDEYDAVVFLNSESSYKYAYLLTDENNVWEKIYPVVLKKRVYRKPIDGILTNLDDEVIYMYINNEKIKYKMKGFSMKNTLENSNIEIQVNKFCSEEEERIRVLEGMLAASEKKVEYYKKIIDSLENKED